MPKGVVTETCLAPECNLTEKDIEPFLDEMRIYMELFEPAFQRMEQFYGTISAIPAHLSLQSVIY